MKNLPVFIDYSEMSDGEAERIANTISLKNTESSGGVSFHSRVELPGENSIMPEPVDQVETGLEIGESLCNDIFFSETSRHELDQHSFEAIIMFESSDENRSSVLANLKVRLHKALADTEFKDDANVRKLVILIAVLQFRRELYSEAAGYLKFLITRNNSLGKKERRVVKQYLDSMPKNLSAVEVDSKFLAVAYECAKTCMSYCKTEGYLRAGCLVGLVLIKVDKFDGGFSRLCKVLVKQLNNCSNNHHNKDAVETLAAIFDNLEDLTEHLVSFKVLRQMHQLFERIRLEWDVDIKWKFCKVYVEMLLSGEFGTGLEKLQDIFEDYKKNGSKNSPGSARVIEIMRDIVARYYQGFRSQQPVDKILKDFEKRRETLGRNMNSLKESNLPVVVMTERKQTEMRTGIKRIIELALNALQQLRYRPSESYHVMETLKKLNKKAWTILKPNDACLYLSAKAVVLAAYMNRARPSVVEAEIVASTFQKFEENLASNNQLFVYVKTLVLKCHVDVKLTSDLGNCSTLDKFVLLRMCNTAVDLAVKTFGNWHEDTATAKLVLARVLAMDPDRSKDKNKNIREAAIIVEKVVGPYLNNPLACNHWKRVAYSFETIENFESSMKYARMWLVAVQRMNIYSKIQKANELIERLKQKLPFPQSDL